MMPSGADLEYNRLLNAAGLSSSSSYDGAYLTQLSKILANDDSASKFTKLRSWYAALAGRDTARVNVAMVGASITEGYGVTFDQNQAQRLARLLRNEFPTIGLTSGGRGRVQQAATSVASFPWTYGVTGAIAPGAYDETFHVGGNHRTYKMVGDGSGTKWPWARLTLNGAVTAFDIVHVKTALGGVGYGYYKIDGGGAVAFDTNAATPTPTQLRISSAATSTIEIGALNGSLFLDGINEYNGDENKGIQVHNFGHGSYTINNWNTNFVAGSWAYSIAQYAPNLLILSDLFVNDFITTGGNRTPAQAISDLQSFIANLRTAGVTCPILLVANYKVVPPATSFVQAWENYVAAMRDYCSSTTDVVFLDHSMRMPATSDNSLGLYNADLLHCTPKGYGLMADTLMAGIRVKS